MKKIYILLTLICSASSFALTLEEYQISAATERGNALAALERWYEVLASGLHGEVDERGRTFIHHAVALEDVLAVAATLLRDDLRGNVEAQDNSGFTPLYIAGVHGSILSARILISLGANVNHTSIRNTTPLIAAVRYSHAAMVNLLIANGANVNFVSFEGNTPLHLAAATGNVEIIRALVDAGALVDTQNEAGQTPIWLAANNGHLDAVIELILLGADPSIANNAGVTPTEEAEARGHVDVVMVFEQNASLRDWLAPFIRRVFLGAAIAPAALEAAKLQHRG